MFFSIAMAFLMGLSPGKSADSSYHMRYDMPIGKSYVYRVTTDQFVLPKTGLRLHTRLTMDVVGRDEDMNIICRLKMTSDTAFDNTDMITYRPVGELKFGGHRLFADAGFLEIKMDEQGHLVDNKTSMDDSKRSPATVTQFERITDASLVAGNNTNGPYLLQLLMPTVPDGENVAIGQVYTDTVTMVSRSVHLPTSYGSTGVAEREILYDTIYRKTTLDSVYTHGAVSIGHMTIRTDRHNALGGHYEAVSNVVRDMRTGMIQHIREKCYRILRNGDRKINYYATAELIDTHPIKYARSTDGTR